MGMMTWTGVRCGGGDYDWNECGVGMLLPAIAKCTTREERRKNSCTMTSPSLEEQRSMQLHGQSRHTDTHCGMHGDWVEVFILYVRTQLERAGHWTQSNFYYTTITTTTTTTPTTTTQLDCAGHWNTYGGKRITREGRARARGGGGGV